MKILMINTVPTEKNGVTNVIFNLHRGLDKSDMRIDLLSINQPDSSYISRIEASGGRVYELHRSIARSARYIWELARLIRQNGYRIVHAHGNSATLALEMLAAWLGGCKVRIAHCHNTICKYIAVHRLLLPLFGASCSHRLACGMDAGRWLYGNKPFTVINNGIDTETFRFSEEDRQQLRSTLHIPPQRKLIGHVGLFNEAKNQRFLVDILEQLLQTGGDWGLLLVGEGELRRSVEQHVSEQGLEDHVIFAGTTDAVAEHLSACDLLCMPSLYEGLPLTLIEAQANGLCCVISENITREADKTGNVRFLSLDSGAAFWAESIRRLEVSGDRNEASCSAVEKIKHSGYAIDIEAEKLKDYYLRATGVE